MRPGTRRRISLNAEAWTLCRASILSFGSRARREPRGARSPDRSLDSGKLNPAGAGTRCVLGSCSLNMVVKLQPEIHNHACLVPLGAGQTWLFTRNFVKRGASGLQPRRAFSFTDPASGGCNRPGETIGDFALHRQGPTPCQRIDHRQAAINSLTHPALRGAATGRRRRWRRCA